MKSSYNEKTKYILFYSVLFFTEVKPVVTSLSCDGPMKTSKLKEEDLMTKVLAFETQTKGWFSITFKLTCSQFTNSFKIKCNSYLFETVK